MLLYSGMFGAFGFGAGMPGFCYYFGTMIDGVANVGGDNLNASAGGPMGGGGMINLSD